MPRFPLRLHHVALNVRRLEACEGFYGGLLGLEVVWRPDDDNVYLSSGGDNLALHRASETPRDGPQRIDHVGFAVAEERDVDALSEFLATQGVRIIAPARTHRDGSRSFYCVDPDGNTVQILYEPRIAMTLEQEDPA